MGWSRRFEAFINPVFLLIRPIPPLAWIPLALVWFGLGITAKVFVVWFAAFVPALINTYTGVRNVDPTLIAAARSEASWGRAYHVHSRHASVRGVGGGRRVGRRAAATARSCRWKASLCT